MVINSIVTQAFYMGKTVRYDVTDVQVQLMRVLAFIMITIK